MTSTELRDTLERLKINQCQFARFVGRGDRQVRNWISGHTRMPHWVVWQLKQLEARRPR